MSAESEFPVENEMVFMLDSAFSINDIVCDPKKCMRLIYMSSYSDLEQNKRKYEEQIHPRLQETS